MYSIRSEKKELKMKQLLLYDRGTVFLTRHSVQDLHGALMKKQFPREK